MYACHSSTAKRPPQHHAQKNFLHFLPDHALKIFFHFLPVCNISSKIAFPAAAQRQIATQKTAVLQLTAEEKFTSSRRCLTANKLARLVNCMSTAESTMNIREHIAPRCALNLESL